MNTKDYKLFASDNAPQNIAEQRRAALVRLATNFRLRSPQSIVLSEQLENSVSDVLLTNAYRVPFQYRNFIRNKLKFGSIVDAYSGAQLKVVDGNWSYDLSGSY
jgi:glutamate-1-semialdehyde 2,1-aminomutase